MLWKIVLVLGILGVLLGLAGTAIFGRAPDRNGWACQLGGSGDPDHSRCRISCNIILRFPDRSDLCDQEP